MGILPRCFCYMCRGVGLSWPTTPRIRLIALPWLGWIQRLCRPHWIGHVVQEGLTVVKFSRESLVTSRTTYKVMRLMLLIAITRSREGLQGLVISKVLQWSPPRIRVMGAAYFQEVRR
uniref:Uncharacterized protein n=1 Tax=Opuntia streptacantha TaxID=393608 RepID=A0A7C9B0D0_OPUST